MRARRPAARRDPTKTTLLAAHLARAIRSRLFALAREVEAAVGEDDLLGLAPPPGLAAASNAAGPFRFRTDDQKAADFQAWWDDRVRAGLTGDAPDGSPWPAGDIGRAYRRGRSTASRRATADLLAGVGRPLQPSDVGRVKLLASRTLADLRGVSQEAASRMTKVLARALAAGDNPRKAAREMAKSVRDLGRARALRIARTEIVHAHAEGQLDGFEEAGVKSVRALAEWSTAGDDEVCSLCRPLEGAVFTVAQARGLIPRHPNCRCAWVPAVEPPSTWRRSTRAALEDTVGGEGGYKKSRWLGRERLKAADLHRKAPPPKKKAAPPKAPPPKKKAPPRKSTRGGKPSPSGGGKGRKK